MSQSLSEIYLHIIFSTKHREAVLHKTIQPELWGYMGSMCNKLECLPVKVGGYYDYVHILCRLSKKIAVMKLLEEIKKASSKWVKTNGAEFSKFHWQDGYGAFSVNPTQLEVVINYIENQDLHHTTKTFQDEYRRFLKKYNVAFDERFIWD